MVLVDNQTGYRCIFIAPSHPHAEVTKLLCIYGIKTKDETIKVVKQWYSYITDLCARHKLMVVMRDKAGESKSQEIQEFFESVGVRNHFSMPKEQCQMGQLNQPSIQLC